MGLEGNYRQIGNETLKEIYNSLKNDNKIDKKEFDKIKLAVMADGNKTKGEIDLLNKIEDSLNKNEKIKTSDFEPKGNSINFDLKISKNNIQISDSKEENFKSKIPIEKLSQINETIITAIQWLDENNESTIEEYKQKRTNLEDIFTPIFLQTYNMK